MNSTDNIGLTYIRKLYNYSMQELADLIGVSKQTISKWENRKKSITPDRLIQLSKLFKQDEQYFTKNLIKSDELRIQQTKLINEEDELNLTEIIEDNEGNKVEIPISIYTNQLEDLSDDTAKTKVIEEVQEILSKVKYRDIDESGIYDWDVVTSLREFIDIIKSRKVSRYSLGCILTSINIAYGINNKNIERYSDNEDIKDLVSTLKDNRDRLQQRQNTDGSATPQWLEELFK